MSTLHAKKRFIVVSYIIDQDVFATVSVRARQPILSENVKFGRNRRVSCSATLSNDFVLSPRPRRPREATSRAGTRAPPSPLA